ncbi:MAG TPA: hypothetical protein VJ810_22330, partial [Blastocatellia bacterium]|nr:hypothetical protein [Blastocatellia bacterium]
MQVCPRCGSRREASTPIRASAPVSISMPAPPEQYRANFQIPVGATSKRIDAAGGVGHPALTRNMVALSPEDAKRRFPLFTPAQWTLMAIGAGLLVMMIVIAYLLWRQQQRDASPPASQNIIAVQPSPNATTTPAPTLT